MSKEKQKKKGIVGYLIGSTILAGITMAMMPKLLDILTPYFEQDIGKRSVKGKEKSETVDTDTKGEDNVNGNQ